MLTAVAPTTMQDAQEGTHVKGEPVERESVDQRQLRREYRQLLGHLEDSKDDPSKMDTYQLLEAVNKADQLFSTVETTQDATLDSRLLVTAADLGAQRARKLKADGTYFELDVFLGRIRTLTRKPALEQLDEEGPEQVVDVLDWDPLRRIASKYSLRPPTLTFMLGPLALKPKVRAQASQRAKLVKDVDALQRPIQLQEEDIERSTNETTTNVKVVNLCLAKAGPMNYFRFIINPDSFGQTVENNFYLSFLVRDGKASVVEQDGQPIVSTATPADAHAYATGSAQKKQLVMELDWNTWEEAIKVYNIKTSVIPTRAEMVLSTGKWYG